MDTKCFRAFARLVLGLSLVGVLTFGVVGPASGAETIHVKAGYGDGHDGSSWTEAYHDLQDALAAAGIGDQIWVAAGVYTPGDAQSDTFTLKSGVAIYGGFAGTETQLSQALPDLNVTILSGDIGTWGELTDNAYHVLTASGVTNTAILDGFTITGGNANGAAEADQHGGGILNEGGSPTLSRVIFSGNKASKGGGMYNSGGSATLTNVTFTGNSAVYGAGIANVGSSPTLNTATFSSNSATDGGGMYNSAGGSATLTNVTFVGNSAVHGAGIANVGSSPTLNNATFSGNSAADGGGMFNNGADTNPSLTNATFRGNWAHLGGGVMNIGGDPTLTNVTFRTNWASDGGAMYDYQGTPSLTNVTFTQNASGNDGGGMYSFQSDATLTNVTFRGNTAASDGGGMHNDGSSPRLTDVDFTGNSAAAGGGGMNNITSGSPKLTSVTFSGNWAASGGGLFCQSNSPEMTNVTFSGNGAQLGGGIYHDGCNTTLTNVTISGNSASTTGGAMYSWGSALIIDDAIFWGNGTEIAGGATDGPLSDIILQGGGCPTTSCTNVIAADPKLGPLYSNGGFTKTMALGAGSAAIDAGGANSACASKDQRGVTRPQGGKCDIGAYEVKANTYSSVGTYDGWLLESGENTGLGGAMDSAAGTLRLGDDASNRQYRGLLSFNTATLPDAASIVLARVKVKKQAITGTDPFGTHGALNLSLKKPYFGTALGLQIGDFQATATVTGAGTIGSTPVSGWYMGLLNSTGRAAVNKTGTTQLRLRFATDDNNDHGADYVLLYSGNAGTSAYGPVLVVYYNP